jgi:hypothetical protein
MHCCLSPAFFMQSALAAARAAFKYEIEFADAANRGGAWAATERQLQLAFAALMERIRRQEAERQVAFGELLRAAKAAGLAALDVQGLIKRLEGCTDEDEAEKQVQVRTSGQISGYGYRYISCIHKSGRGLKTA